MSETAVAPAPVEEDHIQADEVRRRAGGAGCQDSHRTTPFLLLYEIRCSLDVALVIWKGCPAWRS
jgi:hypothetical protein